MNYIVQKKFKNIFKVLCISPLLIIFINLSVVAEESRMDLLKTNWSFGQPGAKAFILLALEGRRWLPATKTHKKTTKVTTEKQ